MPLRGNVQVFDFTVLSNTQVAQNLYRVFVSPWNLVSL